MSEPELDVLIPTYERPAALAVTLTALAAQDAPFRVFVSDQSTKPVEDDPLVAAVLRVVRLRHEVVVHHHQPPRGVAENRQFLLEQAGAAFVLYLDDDVVIAPGTVRTLREVMDEQQCGFVAMAMIGLSHADDERPDELTAFEPVQGRVEPERVRKGEPGWERWRLHNAANPLHLARRLGLDDGRRELYRVAWASGCVLYDRRKLLDCGGFSFWQRVPRDGAGEDVVAQLRVLERFGGVGVLPSTAYHLELPTTIPDRRVDAYAEVLERG